MRLLVTSIGDKVPLLEWAGAALVKIGGGTLVGQDRDETVTGRGYVHEFHRDIPTDCDVIIPTRDGEIEWIRSYGAIVPDAPARFTDKLRFAEYCQALGIKHPRTTTNHEELALPMVSKGRLGAGTRDFRILLTHQFIIAKEEPEQIYQERVTGQEYTCDAYYTREGKLHGYVVRTRDRVKHGESAVTTVTTDPHINTVCGDYLRRFHGMYGHINMQLIGDTVIEVNPRIGGASMCSFYAGLDSLYWSLLEAMGERLPPFKLTPVRLVRVARDMVTYV